MRIAIDCYELIKGKGKSIGIYNYTKNLLDGIINDSSIESNIIIFCNKYNFNDFNYGDRAKSILINGDPTKISCKLMWELFLSSYYNLKYKIDKYFSPRGFSPLIKNCQVYITLHDLIPYYYYENYKNDINAIENFYIRKRLEYSAKLSDGIITVSEFSKKEIMRRFNLPDKKITVIYNGLHENIYNVKQNTKKEDYIFSISSELQHKNYIGLLKSYELYYKNTKNAKKLVVCGIKNSNKYRSYISNDAFNNITNLGYINDDELYNYYMNASLFIFVSKIEGFGFPPLEAMQYKIPVICSNTSSLEEIVGNGAVLVNPDDYQQISDAIIMLENNMALRSKLIKNSENIIKNFNWERCCKLHISALDL